MKAEDKSVPVARKVRLHPEVIQQLEELAKVYDSSEDHIFSEAIRDAYLMYKKAGPAAKKPAVDIETKQKKVANG